MTSTEPYFQNLVGLLLGIDEKLNGWEDNLKIDGKNIQRAVVEQPSWLAYYDQVSVEADSILYHMDMHVKRIRGERFVAIKYNATREYTDTAIQRVIDADPEYITTYKLYLEVRETYEKCKSIVDAFKQRAYSLNNIVKIREHELENITIRLE